jgi:hypothetical protein
MSTSRVLNVRRGYGDVMRFVMYGLVFAALIYVISGGHLFLLPLFFVLPLGGGLFHRRRRTARW